MESQNPPHWPHSPYTIRPICPISLISPHLAPEAHCSVGPPGKGQVETRFDRMLIAQAASRDMKLLSHDDNVLRYGAMTLGF